MQAEIGSPLVSGTRGAVKYGEVRGRAVRIKNTLIVCVLRITLVYIMKYLEILSRYLKASFIVIYKLKFHGVTYVKTS